MNRLLCMLLCLLSGTFSVWSQPLDAGSFSRAGVHDLSQRSSNVVGWNSAILAVDSVNRTTIEIPVGVTGSASNNSFSVKFWNKNIAGDHNWTADDQNRILDRIPGNKFQVMGQFSASGIGVTYKQFGLDIAPEGSGYATLPKDLMRLAFMGNQLNRNYAISDFYGDSYMALNWGLGFGYKFDQEYIPMLCGGIGFHFYQGLSMAKVAQSDGNLIVTDSLISGYSVLHTLESVQGDGVGFDLSGLAKFSDQWEAGLSLRQIGANITWDVDENQLSTFYTDSAGVIVDSLDQDGYLKRVFHSTDTTYGGGTIETQLPLIVQANGKYRLSRKVDLMAEALVRTKNSAQGNSGLEFNLATKVMPLPWLVVQGGVGFGGPYQTRFGIGSGLRFRHYEMDLGWNWNGGLFNSARGIGFSLSQRLLF